jgi:acyl-coenzyme A synthetase/AMP-(fatty) acid ligase
MKTYPEKDFFNAYGPTECTGISTVYKVGEIEQNVDFMVPIGNACSNTEVFSIVNSCKLADIEEIGELYIRGSSVGSGYWNDTEKTHMSFVDNPLDRMSGEKVYKTGDLVKQLVNGNYLFIGRKDSQIKHMGYRIELGEIEHALMGIEHVKDVAVIATTIEDHENGKIIAYIEADEKCSVDVIREKAKERLPKHMVPEKIEILGKIRRMENGKIDRQFLKAYSNRRNVE